METVEKKTTFRLPVKKVKVKPIRRARGMIKDPKHYGFFLIPNSYIEFTTPKDKNGSIICPLDEEERSFFEDKKLSGMAFERGDLSPYKKKDNYWTSKSSRVRLKNEDYTLDLSNPKDYITYKILLKNKNLIAPSVKDIKKKQTYLFAIVDEDEELTISLSKADRVKEAWKFFGKIEDSHLKMMTFLKAFGRKPSHDVNINFLKNEITKIIEDPQGLTKMIDIINNPDYEYLALFSDAVSMKILNKTSGKYFLSTGEPLAEDGEQSTLENAIMFLKNNQETELFIRAKIREKKKV